METKRLIPVIGVLLAALLFAGAASADTERRLLRASEGLQMPGSEADSEWWFVSYSEEKEVPTPDRMARLTGCADAMTRSGFDETFGRLGRVEPWMDQGQRKSARGFGKLAGIFDGIYGDDLAVYRCASGGPEVPIYFVGVDENGLSGLKTINIET